jgi:hypothetical protein
VQEGIQFVGVVVSFAERIITSEALATEMPFEGTSIFIFTFKGYVVDGTFEE